METSYSKYQLWSPPALDLSLDSFSNDLIQEFDKSRNNIDLVEKKQTTLNIVDEKEVDRNSENKHHQNEDIKAALVESSDHNHTSIILPTPDPSSVTFPPSECETSLHDEEAPSTANLFRKSSTFLKKKLSQNGGSSKKDEICSIQTTNAEDITDIVSRQYPPKPLQYSPVVEPSSSNHTSISTASQLQSAQNSKDMENASTLKSSIRNSVSNKRASNPISLVSNSTSDNSPSSLPTVTRAITTTPAGASASTATSTPKRRSFFSLRFC